MRRKVIVLQTAQTDVREIIHFIKQNVSNRSSITWRRMIEQGIEELAANAEQWPLSDILPVELTIRERIVGKKKKRYRIFYRILHDRVLVYRVLMAAQNDPEADEFS